MMESISRFADETSDKGDNGQSSDGVQTVQKATDITKAVDSGSCIPQESIEVAVF